MLMQRKAVVAGESNLQKADSTRIDLEDGTSRPKYATTITTTKSYGWVCCFFAISSLLSSCSHELALHHVPYPLHLLWLQTILILSLMLLGKGLGAIGGRSYWKPGDRKKEIILWLQIALCWGFPLYLHRFLGSKLPNTLYFASKCVAMFLVVIGESRLLGHRSSLKQMMCVAIGGGIPLANVDFSFHKDNKTMNITLLAICIGQVISALLIKRALSRSVCSLPDKIIRVAVLSFIIVGLLAVLLEPTDLMLLRMQGLSNLGLAVVLFSTATGAISAIAAVVTRCHGAATTYCFVGLFVFSSSDVIIDAILGFPFSPTKFLNAIVVLFFMSIYSVIN